MRIHKMIQSLDKIIQSKATLKIVVLFFKLSDINVIYFTIVRINFFNQKYLITFI